MEGRVRADASGRLAVDCGVLQHRLDDAVCVPDGVALQPGTRVDVLIRPEHIRLSSHASDPDVPGLVNRVHGTVQESVYMGRSTRYVLALEDGRQLQIRQGAALVAGLEPLQPGDTAQAWWPVAASTVLVHA